MRGPWSQAVEGQCQAAQSATARRARAPASNTTAASPSPQITKLPAFTQRPKVPSIAAEVAFKAVSSQHGWVLSLKRTECGIQLGT